MKSYKYQFCLVLCFVMTYAHAGFNNQTATLSSGLADGRLAWGDYNDDGYVDFLAGGHLWKNNAGAGFTLVYSSLGVGLWTDYDNDGQLDVYNISSRTLNRNISADGSTSFSTVSFPSLPVNVSLGASWADINNDGDIDLYAGGYERWGSVPAYYDAVVENNGGDSFTATYTNLNYRPARGVTSCDFDRDGDQDVFVSNYRLAENVLWQNNGRGSFADVTLAYNADEPECWKGYAGAHTIGSAWGDLDNDGNIDLFVGNFSHKGQPQSQFLRNLGSAGNYHFTDMRATAGLAYQESYASPALGDYDNDGDLDLFFTTVYAVASFGVTNCPVLYRNDGNWNFTDVTTAEGLANLGATYQAAWADFDNDGDLDLVTDGKLFVNNESDTGSNHWLKVKLIGDGTTINTAAIGCEVRIDIGGGKILTRQVEGGTGEGNQNDLTIHFGLGANDSPVDMKISFAGSSVMVSGVAVDQAVRCSVPDLAVIYGQMPK